MTDGMDSLFISLFLFFTVLVLVQCAIRKTKAAQLFDEIPGPTGVPILGNVFEYLVSPTVLFRKARELFSTYRSINRIWLMHVRLVNIYEPNHIEAVLSTTKHNDKEVPYKFLQPWLREGLLLSNGDKWHKRRKILTPAFHFNILKQFAKIIEEQSACLVESLQNEVGLDRTDIIPYITRSTLSIICETSMGISLRDSTKISLSDYFGALHKLGNYAVYRLVRFWLYSDVIFNLTSVGRMQRETLKYLHDFTMKVIQMRRDTKDNVSVVDIEDDGDRKKRRMALLDLLLEAEKGGMINEIGIREEVDTFMFEGHDTTAMALCFAIMMLANEPIVQEKIFEECQMVFGVSDRPATIEDLTEMKYLECCIKESLRLYPSVPFIARYLKEDLKLGNYTVPANTICNIHIYDLHRNNDIYESAESFIPERFLPENSANRNPFSYLPFSAGPRNCIDTIIKNPNINYLCFLKTGKQTSEFSLLERMWLVSSYKGFRGIIFDLYITGQKFAMLEMKSVISCLVRRYRLEAITRPDDLVLTADIVLRATHPIYVRFLRRNK